MDKDEFSNEIDRETVNLRVHIKLRNAHDQVMITALCRAVVALSLRSGFTQTDFDRAVDCLKIDYKINLERDKNDV